MEMKNTLIIFLLSFLVAVDAYAADNLQVTEGSGTTVASDEVTRNAIVEKEQVVKLGLGVDGSHDGFARMGQQTMANSLAVAFASDQSGLACTVSGVSTAANQSTEITSLQLIDDVVHSGDATLSKYATIGAVFDDVSTGTVTENNAQSLRMSSRRALYVEPPASSGAFPASQSGTWNVTNISGTVSLPTGAATSAKQPALGTAGTASSDVITVQGIASMTALKVDGSAVTQPVSGTVTANQGGSNWSQNVAQINGVAPSMGNGVSGTGVQRVTIASDSTGTVAATQSGTWNVTNISGTVSLPTGASTSAKQPALGTAGTASSDVITVQGIASMTALKVDGSAVTQPVSLQAQTTGGLSQYRNLDLNATGVSIKASAGQLYGWYICNRAASERFVKLYDKASAATVGTDTPVKTFPLPAGQCANDARPNGIVFSSGIAAGATTGIADANTGAPTTNDVVVNFDYK